MNTLVLQRTLGSMNTAVETAETLVTSLQRDAATEELGDVFPQPNFRDFMEKFPEAAAAWRVFWHNTDVILERVPSPKVAATMKAQLLKAWTLIYSVKETADSTRAWLINKKIIAEGRAQDATALQFRAAAKMMDGVCTALQTFSSCTDYVEQELTALAEKEAQPA